MLPATAMEPQGVQATTKNKRNEVAPVCGQLGGLVKVYSGCRSSCQNLLGSIFLSPLLRLVEKL